MEAKRTDVAVFSPHLAAGNARPEAVYMPKWGEVLIFSLLLPLRWEKSSLLN
jgi:hypothetical protein